MTDRKKSKRRLTNCRWSAVAQLTLVEHSLCPLKPPPGGFRHEPEYFFFQNGKKHRTTAIVDCPLGLHPKDERSLSRLVALALSGDEPQPNLALGVRYLLRYLELPVGGSNRQQVRETIRRLGNVSYRNENFYDPVTGEIREVSFKFFSYNLPKDDDSFRPWLIRFDPVFFEFCQVWGGFLGYQHRRYKKMRPATGRLFLWLKKMLYPNKKLTPYYDVEYLCVNVLGFAQHQRAAIYTAELRKCAAELAGNGAILLPSGGLNELCEKRQKGQYRVRFERGPSFDQKLDEPLDKLEDASITSMRAIGLDTVAIRNIRGRFKLEVINEAIDVTFARKERGMGFSKSPMAFFVDYCNKRSRGEITKPDWFLQLKKDEERNDFESAVRSLGITRPPMAETQDSWEADWMDYLQSERGQSELELAQEVFGDDIHGAIRELQRRFFRDRKPACGPIPISNLLKVNNN